jgi:nucleoside-diphosphate-sugar epimerase
MYLRMIFLDGRARRSFMDAETDGLTMRTVITGGAGFVGSHLCERFLAEGDNVLCVDNLLTGHRRNIAHLMDNPRFHFLVHNISEPLQIDGPVDNVLHFASPASPADYLAHPIPTLKVGALGTHNALGLAKAKDARFLLASTSEVYGDPEVHPQREEYWGHVNPIGPRGCYDEDPEPISPCQTLSRARRPQASTLRTPCTHSPDTRCRRTDG